MSSQSRRYRVILFDFDGTLVNTTPLILRCFRATWQRLFGHTLGDDAYISTFGLPLATAMAQMLDDLVSAQRIAAPADAAAEVERMIDTYREFNLAWHDEMIRPFAGIDETLRELRGRGCRLGVVTSKKRIGAERGMRLFGMQELFDISICAEDTRNNKPHPEPLLHAMDRLQSAAGETIYVGDSTHDIVAGRAAGIAVAAAAWGPFARAELEALTPDYLLQEPRELAGFCG